MAMKGTDLRLQILHFHKKRHQRQAVQTPPMPSLMGERPTLRLVA